MCPDVATCPDTASCGASALGPTGDESAEVPYDEPLNLRCSVIAIDMWRPGQPIRGRAGRGQEP